ncbi:QueT transporter family protein [Clostridium sp. D2Q-14]|uniref:QueT transporter family protein n=1 Tax=Anaeromonas gelatinilytica TaxID=2683194 RepID=UPI00193C33B3|nr:QueT transporter family protein [Anaeromonas gelatinilytica]MBS4536559.1 QueT transporter family protein [Anaeromonas gelatinilytica]
MKKINGRTIAKIGIVAAIYVILTVAFPLLSYGQVQFRISEVLTLLAFFNPIYVWAVTIGTFFANIASTLGPVDMVVGTLATFLAVYPMTKVKNIWVASLLPALSNGIIIGLQLNILFGLPLLPSMLYVAIGEITVVTIIGVPLMKVLNKKLNFNIT